MLVMFHIISRDTPRGDCYYVSIRYQIGMILMFKLKMFTFTQFLPNNFTNLGDGFIVFNIENIG